MDMIKLINDKIAFFENKANFQKLKSIVQHIKISIKHLENGKKGEDYLFNDAIYRTNQAFEGVLREANSLFNTNNPKGKKFSLYQIEEFLNNEKVLRKRVLSQFQTYRQNWRNESTHNYMAYFSEQEAFLAIVNLYAFFNIILDQMIEAVSYKDVQEVLEARNQVSQVSGPDIQTDIADLLANLPAYIPENLINGNASSLIREATIAGVIRGLLEKERPDVKLKVEPNFSFDNRIYRPDLLIGSGDEQTLLEVKMLTFPDYSHILRGVDQVSKYLVVSGLSKGILLIASSIANVSFKKKKIVRGEGSNKQTIIVVFPESVSFPTELSHKKQVQKQ